MIVSSKYLRRLKLERKHLQRWFTSKDSREQVGGFREGERKLFKDNQRYLYIDAIDKHAYTIIWLHGLGDSAAGFLDVFYADEYMLSPKNTKIILTTAPERKVTLNYGERMNSWYDIYSLGERVEEVKESKEIDVKELADSTDIILNLIDREVKLLDNDYKKIIVGGFSQGAWVSYNVFLKWKHSIGALVCLSGHTPPIDVSDIAEDKKKIPIFWYHGDADPMVPEGLHRRGVKKLKDNGCNISYKIEPSLGHSLSLQEIKDLSKFIKSVTNK